MLSTAPMGQCSLSLKRFSVSHRPDQKAPLFLTHFSAPAKRVMSLKEPQTKMSKSHSDPRSRIHINDSREEVATKIRLALTDSTTGISFDPVERPGVSNLLTLMSYLDGRGRSVNDLVRDNADLSMRAFKDNVTEAIVHGLAGIRARYERLIAADDDHYIEDVAHAGSIEARKRAENMMVTVRQVIGL